MTKAKKTFTNLMPLILVACSFYAPKTLIGCEFAVVQSQDGIETYILVDQPETCDRD